jgi:predicted MFS family arabinose efflux permease
MKLRHYILLMTAFAVISDAILIPFYPQFFAARYHLANSVHAGAYVAAISVVVMVSLQFWSRVARRVDAMHILVRTQCAAGVLAVLSYWAPSVSAFLVLSLAMFACKSAYLLMCPYMMRHEPAAEHAPLLGLMTVIGTFSAIFWGLAGGALMDHWGTRFCVFAMAAGDFLNMLICLHLIRTQRIARRCAFGAAETQAADASPSGRWGARLPILRLALMLAVYAFSISVILPFLSSYWQLVGDTSSKLVSGFVYEIPGMMALAGLLANRFVSDRVKQKLDPLLLNLVLAAGGLLLQSTGHPAAIVAGLCLFGWASFRITVRLSVVIFRLSRPADYAADYSLINFFQNFGALIASFSAGLIVHAYGMRAPFLIAAAGVLATIVFDALLVKVDRAAAQPTDGAGAEAAPATRPVEPGMPLEGEGVPPAAAVETVLPHAGARSTEEPARVC